MAKDPALKDRPPINIWNDIERTSVLRLDIVFEGKTIAGIHHSDFNDIVNDIDWICDKLQQYKKEMLAIYGNCDDILLNSKNYTRIYLLIDNSTGYIKIGRSKQPKLRERTLHAECPQWDMFFISPVTSTVTEKDLHKKFADQRVRGEWFDLDDNDVEYIKNFDYGTT